MEAQARSDGAGEIAGRTANPVSGLWSAVGAAGLFLVLAAGLTWPRLANAAWSVVDTGDPLKDVWMLFWIDHGLLHDPARLYAAPIFYGSPDALAYNDTALGPALLALPLTALTGNLILTYNLLIIASFALAAWSAFLLARHLTGSAAAGLVAGMAFGFWSYTFAHISHLNMLSLYPLPLALLGLHRVFDTPGTRRGAAGGAIVLGAAGFAAWGVWQAANSFYYTAYLGLVAGALVAWEALVVRRWRAWSRDERWARVSLLAGAFGALALGVWLLSAPYRAVQQDQHFYRTAAEQVAWSAHLSDYLSVSPRNRTYHTVLPNAWPEPLFPGFAVLALGAVGLVLLLRRPRGPVPPPGPPGSPAARSVLAFYALLAGGAVLLSLGPQLDLGAVQVPLPYQLLAGLPGFDGLRAPGRFAVLAMLGWGVLAGWALSRLPARGGLPAKALARLEHSARPHRRSTLVRAGIGLFVLAVMAGEQWVVLTPTTAVAQGAATPPVVQWLAARPDGGVVVEFPLAAGLQDPSRTGLTMFYQTIHQHPLVNGYSSFLPPGYTDLVRQLDEDVAITPADIGILQSLDVRYIVFDRPAYKTSHWALIQDNLRGFPEAHRAGEWGDEFAGSMVYTLDPLPPAADLTLTATLPAQAAPGATVPLTITLTHTYRYPLLTRLQPQLSLAGVWSLLDDGPDNGPPPGASVRLALTPPLVLAPGTYTLTTGISAPAQPGHYQFEVRAVGPLPHYQGSSAAPFDVGEPPAGAGR
jgi:hypothetical protein